MSFGLRAMEVDPALVGRTWPRPGFSARVGAGSRLPACLSACATSRRIHLTRRGVKRPRPQRLSVLRRSGFDFHEPIHGVDL
jgi:hypothetical protein